MTGDDRTDIISIVSGKGLLWKLDIKRGDILEVDFGEAKGSVQGGRRPALVIQNDVGNKFSPTTIVCPLTTANKPNIPTHGILRAREISGLKYDSTFLGEHPRTINKSDIISKWGSLSRTQMADVDTAIIVSVGVQEMVREMAQKMMIESLGRMHNVPARQCG